MMKRVRSKAVAAALVLALVPAAPPSAATQSPEQAAAAAVDLARTRFAEPPRSFEPFTLTDSDDQQFQSSRLRGEMSLVFFGFTNCDQVCPATLQVLRQARTPLEGSLDAPRVVLISVDGDRDTPEAMRKYLAPFGTGFVGLTGDPKLVRDIAAQFSAVFFKGAPADKSGAYQVEHTSQVYLLDRSGRLRATFFGATAAEIESVVRRVAADSKTSG